MTMLAEIYLVDRGLRHHRPEGREDAARRTKRVAVPVAESLHRHLCSPLHSWRGARGEVNSTRNDQPPCASRRHPARFRAARNISLERRNAQIVQPPSQLVCTISAVAKKPNELLNFQRGMALAITPSSRGRRHPCLPNPIPATASLRTVSFSHAQDKNSFSRRCAWPT